VLVCIRRASNHRQERQSGWVGIEGKPKADLNFAQDSSVSVSSTFSRHHLLSTLPTQTFPFPFLLTTVPHHLQSIISGFLVAKSFRRSKSSRFWTICILTARALTFAATINILSPSSPNQTSCPPVLRAEAMSRGIKSGPHLPPFPSPPLYRIRILPNYLAPQTPNPPATPSSLPSPLDYRTSMLFLLSPPHLIVQAS
jgi:hypothetical protein